MPTPSAPKGGSTGPKLPGYTMQRRLFAAKLREYTLVEKFLHGYRNREDITTLPPGVLVQGSQNVLTNTFQRVGIRKGYTLDGQRDITSAPISSSYDWQPQYSTFQNLRAGFNTIGSNGKLQFRYTANASDRYKTNTFSAGQVYWIDLVSSLSSVNFNFTSFWDTTELIEELLFVNGSSQIWEWSGGVTTIASTSNASGVIATFDQPGVITTLILHGGSVAAGGGYHAGDVVTVTGGGTNATAQVTSIATGGAVMGIQLMYGGGGYTTGTSIPVTGGYGNGLLLDITSVSATPGTGYVVGDILTANGGGANATFIVQQIGVAGAVSQIMLTNPGTGYSTGTGISLNGGTGTGAKFNIDTVATGYIQKTGTTSWAQNNFYLSKNQKAVVINGNPYPYTSGANTTFLVGITGNPTAEPANSVAWQNPLITMNTAILGVPFNLQNNLISVLANQIYLTGVGNNFLYISKVNNYKDFTFSSPSLATDGRTLSLDASPVALDPQESAMFVSAGQQSWYSVSSTSSSDNTTLVWNANKIKTTGNQGAQSQALTTKIRNVIAFISNEPTMDTLGTETNYLNDPQAVDIGLSIVNDLQSYNYTNGSVFYFQKYLYVSIPSQGLIRVYNMTDDKNPYWEAPLTIPAGRFANINGSLYFHSSASSNTFKLFDGYSDDGRTMNAIAAFSFENLGVRTVRKSFDAYYAEGYISSNTTLNLNFQFDVGGAARSTTIPILGTDTQIVPPPRDMASLGKESLGNNSLGGSVAFAPSTATPPKFRVEKTLPRQTSIHFEYQPSFSSSGINQRWELIAFGPNSSPTYEEPTFIKE